MKNNILRRHMFSNEEMQRKHQKNNILRQPVQYIDTLYRNKSLLEMVSLSEDYYDKVSGIFLGGSNSPSAIMRLIDKDRFHELYNAGDLSALQNESKLITIDDFKIQKDLQDVADNSSKRNANRKYQEHQMFITLDREAAIISSMPGPPGELNKTYFEYHYSPASHVNIIDQPRRLVLIGQVHGHPPTDKPGEVTEKTMSEDYDKPASANANIPIYGIDAMNGLIRGRKANIHRVTPDGEITLNVGKTSDGFNIGLEAMQIWGRRALTREL